MPSAKKRRFSEVTSDDKSVNMKKIKLVTDAFAKNANKARAEHNFKYLKEKGVFYGIQTPLRRELSKPFILEMDTWNEGRGPNMAQLNAITKWAFDDQKREVQHFATDALMRYVKPRKKQPWQLVTDLTSTEKTDAQEIFIEMMTNCLTHKTAYWDWVDMLATNVLGPVVALPEASMLDEKLMDQWIEHDNMWVRRAAILHQLHYKEHTNEEQLFRYCLQCGHEKGRPAQGFFISKAIGWSLRHYSRTAPQAVTKFVKENQDKLQPDSCKEALRLL